MSLARATVEIDHNARLIRASDDLVLAGGGRSGGRYRWSVDPGDGQRRTDLTIDFADRSTPVLLAGDVVVGSRVGPTVRLHGSEYRYRRSPLAAVIGTRFTVSSGERVVLTVRRRSTTREPLPARRFAVGMDPGLDPVVALALVLLRTRPCRPRLAPPADIP